MASRIKLSQRGGNVKELNSRERPEGALYWYDGTLHWPVLSQEIRKAYRCWANQINRCENSKNPKYSYYGARGIEVRYRSREFIGWWLETSSSFLGTKKTVGRIDHQGHYEFGNIEFQEHIDNCVKEPKKRLELVISDSLKKSILIYDYASGEKLMIVSSGQEAQNLTGVWKTQISAIAKRKPNYHQSKGYGFSFVN